MNNVIVKVQKGDKLITPDFRQCLVSLCQQGVDFSKIRLKLCNDSLIIDNGDVLKGDSYILQHSKFCPFKELDQSLKLDKDGLRIPVAVSVILESWDNHILLTRRSSRLRSSPNVWVPPDRGETLIECGLRELFEETGILIEEGKSRIRILCVWENVFPIILGFGLPKSHELVVYFHVKCQKSHKDLISDMKINPEEVEAFAWLPAQAVIELFQNKENPSYCVKQFTWTDGALIETNLNYLTIYNKAIWSSRNMYSGVQASISTWLKNHLMFKNKL